VNEISFKVVTEEEVGKWKAVNYFDEEGNLVIAPDTPEFRKRKRELEFREFGTDEVAELVNGQWVVEDLEFVVTPAETELVVIEQPTKQNQPDYSTWASPDYAICANCNEEIWQARRRKNWRSNVCDGCYWELIAPSKKTVTLDYNSDGSVRSASDCCWWQTDYECDADGRIIRSTGPCTPSREGILTA